MNLLVTNDDGIDAAGLATLADVARRIGPATVVAPAKCHSACSHRVTTEASFRVTPHDAGGFVVEGTPADCVRVALTGLVPEVDWVLAGINHGGNLGHDVHLSGTVAAVREAVLMGKPGVAVSHYHRRGVDLLDWPRTGRWLEPVLRDLLSRPWTPGTWWNINLPHIPADAPDPEVVFCLVDPSPLGVSYAREGDLWKYNGNYHTRPRAPGKDVDVCFSGKIAVSRLELPGVGL